ncbi:MAG: phosphatidylglycerol:prolipoprotein diacylglycerol transferase [Candidatus Peribacteria bacterium]|nr:phosphatidylglycerol:prolipoprotein diacylglycerol transferase [Candidatus Peribacteria bacterium]
MLFIFQYTKAVISLFPSRTVAFIIGGFPVHWYGIMYLLAFVCAFIILPNIQHYRKLYLTRDEWASVISASVIGVIVGGRLGYVLFYEPQYFAQHPLEILAVWNGGMASHGGFIGVAIALAYICWKMKLDIRKVADVAVIAVAVGLAFGRFGNFINQELYGTVTTLPWGIHIPGVEGLRHPTQIYAIIKDLFIALVCYFHLRYTQPFYRGRTAALFLMLYGVLRFFKEYLMVQDYPLIPILGFPLSREQLLTIPIFLIGALLWVIYNEKEEA